MLTPTDADEALAALHASRRRGDERQRAWLTELPARDLLRLDERARFTSWLRANPLGDSKDWRRVVKWGGVVGACVAAMHPDGYLRERAALRLARSDASIATRFLALRAVDHVEQVRDAARRGLAQRTSAVDLAPALGMLMRLRGRDHGEAALTAYLESVERSRGPEFPLALFAPDDSQVRRFGYEAAIDRRLLASSAIEDLLASETDQWSRRRLAEHWVHLDPSAAKDGLLHSRYVEGRLIALWELPDAVFTTSDLERRMLDKSSRIREAARWRYRRAGHDPVTFYQGCWEASGLDDSEVDRVLAGLRECGQTLSEAEARAGLGSGDAKTRFAALRLWPTDPPPKAVLLDLLADPGRAVVKHAAKALATISSVRYDDVDHAASSELVNQRRGAWLVRRNKGDWNRVRGDLEAMQDGDPELASLAKGDLLIWLERRAPTTYTPPFPSEKEAIRAMLDRVALDPDTTKLVAFHAGVGGVMGSDK